MSVYLKCIIFVSNLSLLLLQEFHNHTSALKLTEMFLAITYIGKQLSDMRHCERHSDCDPETEKCQNGLCVVRSGGVCKHHFHCPQFEVCVKKKCQKQKCKSYKDCSKIHPNLMCHPIEFCSGKALAFKNFCLKFVFTERI